MLPPNETEEFCKGHGASVVSCLGDMLGLTLQELQTKGAHLSLGAGGLGLRSAVSVAPAAY